MKKKNVLENSAKSSNTILTSGLLVDVEDNTTTKRKPQVLHTNLDDTKSSVENNEMKKAELFANIKSLFGFETFDKEENAKALASDLATGKITFAEFSEKMRNGQKSVNALNADKELLSFEAVCEKIQNSSYIDDLYKIVGTKDLLSLKSLLVTDSNKVIFYHAKQSEENEKFESVKVSVKGAHKEYFAFCFSSVHESSVSNICKSLSNFQYYRDAKKRSLRMKKEETNDMLLFADVVNRLKEKHGFSGDEIAKML